MLRKIIKIDENRCNGCGACAGACHEGAIEMVKGKAKLTKEHYCDGLGDCLPACPTDAISFELREAPAYDEAAVMAEKLRRSMPHQGGCPGSMVKAFDRTPGPEAASAVGSSPSRLGNWPVQIKLAPLKAAYFDNANLLVAADCTAFSYGNFHNEFIRNHVTLIGCPKLDMVDYKEKLSAIIGGNDIRSLTIVRMEVPCCGGIEQAAKEALRSSGTFIPWRVVTISTEGRILD